METENRPQTGQINLSIEDAFGDLGIGEADIHAIVDRSLNPRSPYMLFDKLAGIMGESNPSESHLLDVGCREGDHAVEIARRFGCRVTGVDLVDHNVEVGNRRVEQFRMSKVVRLEKGDVQNMGFPDGEFDHVWCRDMLCHVPDLAKAFAECARVLKPRGTMLVYNTFQTELMEPQEALRLYAPLAILAQNMATDYFEDAIASAGLTIVERDEVGSEWKEYVEESAHMLTSKQLLRIARMKRARDTIVEKIGIKAYEVELAVCHWAVYQMLGKLSSRVYVLAKER